MDWARILAFVTGLVDQELLAQNEYLVAENRILKAQSQGRLKLTDAERATLSASQRDGARRLLALPRSCHRHCERPRGETAGGCAPEEIGRTATIPCKCA